MTMLRHLVWVVFIRKEYTLEQLSKLLTQKNNIDRYAYIETAVDFSKLQTVLVITNE